MNNLKFRTLRADEIECRPATVTAKGLSLLLYKDARCDMNILDETVGPMSWERSHDLIGNNLYCTVSIMYQDEDNQIFRWVSKEDVGTESNMEAEKGQASDAFKRACFNWGIGRELYTAPRIWINADDANIQQVGTGKFACYDRFIVEQILYDDRKIVALSIKNASKGHKRVFTWDGRKK